MKKVWLVVLFTTVLVGIVAFGNENVRNLQKCKVDTMETLDSFRKIGDFYVLEYFGDYGNILEIMDNIYTGDKKQKTNIECSFIASTYDQDALLMGRNFDNPYCDVLLTKYAPSDGYSSLAFTRMSDLGYANGTNFENLTQQQKLKILYSPYFVPDGINETGLSVGLAYVRSLNIAYDSNKETIWITHLIREILDHAQTVDEACEIANSYNVVDGSNAQGPVVSHHLMVVDGSGNSAVLEYADGEFKKVIRTEPWHAVTNSPIYNQTDQSVMSQCWRYNILINSFNENHGDISYREGMGMLSSVSVANMTQWSAIYDNTNKGLFVAIRRAYDNLAYIDLENFNIKNYGKFYLNEIDIIDENNDGYFEMNEELTMNLGLNADFFSENVSAVISSENGNILFTNTISDFGDINNGSIGNNNSNPFKLKISHELENKEVVFSVRFTTGYDYTYNLNFTFDFTEFVAINNSTINPDFKTKNCPNPFNPSTTIKFTSTNQGKYTVEIYNLLGEKIATVFSGEMNEGPREIIWNGKDEKGNTVASGSYFYKIIGEDNSFSGKMLLMK